MIQVYIDSAPHQYGSRVWIIETADFSRFILTWDKTGWVRNKIGEGAASDTPSLFFPFEISEQLFKAFADAISNKGIKPDSYAILEGEIKATKLHLDDMRKLVFK